MGHTATDYKYRIASMLPRGLIDWLRTDPRVTRLLTGLGVNAARHEVIVESFASNCIPTQSTGDGLTRWESTLNLPDLDAAAVDSGSVSARQIEVGRALASGGTATLVLFEAQAAVHSLTATAAEYLSTFPCEVYLRGPVAEVGVFRFGTSGFNDDLSFQSATWKKVANLAARITPAHVRVHHEDSTS